MSDDIEDLLRSGLAARADAAPSYDDPGLADAAIAGAGRIRRRRRVASAASGAGLLVLGAAAFVYQPWFTTDDHDGDGTTAADTSTVEVQNELDMEFVIADDSGSYSVLNQDGDSVALGDTEPTYVYRLADAYLAESPGEVWTVSVDGASGATYPKATEESYTKVSTGGEQFAIVTPTSDYESEEYSLYDVTIADSETEEEVEPVAFTTSYAVTLADWNETTAVFTADLNSVTGGSSGSYYFNDDLEYGLETVSTAGFEAALLVDSTDPSNVCVSDLYPAEGTASGTEYCGPIDSAELQSEFVAATGTEVDPAAVSESVKDQVGGEYIPLADADLGKYETRYLESMYYWTDPADRWQVSGTPGEDTWLLVDASGEEPKLSELEPPSGALMPVLSYT